MALTPKVKKIKIPVKNRHKAKEELRLLVRAVNNSLVMNKAIVADKKGK